MVIIKKGDCSTMKCEIKMFDKLERFMKNELDNS